MHERNITWLVASVAESGVCRRLCGWDTSERQTGAGGADDKLEVSPPQHRLDTGLTEGSITALSCITNSNSLSAASEITGSDANASTSGVAATQSKGEAPWTFATGHESGAIVLRRVDAGGRSAIDASATAVLKYDGLSLLTRVAPDLGFFLCAHDVFHNFAHSEKA